MITDEFADAVLAMVSKQLQAQARANRPATRKPIVAISDDCPWCLEPRGALGKPSRRFACPGCGDHVTGPWQYTVQP